MSSGPYYGIVLDVRYTAYGGGDLLSRVLIFSGGTGRPDAVRAPYTGISTR